MDPIDPQQPRNGPKLPNPGKQPDRKLVRIYMYLGGVYLK